MVAPRVGAITEINAETVKLMNTGAITLAPKKLIRTRRASEGSASEPSLVHVGLVCARMRNFLAGVIDRPEGLQNCVRR